MDYNLFTRQSKSKIVFKYKDEGVALGDNTFSWTGNKIEKSRPYSDIAQINPTVNYIPKSGYTGSCFITFKDGDVLNIVSTNSLGLPDSERTQAYGAFLKALHERLVPYQDILFNAGTSSGLHKFRVFAVILAVLLFLVAPVIIFILTEQPKALGIAAVGAFLTFGLIRTTKANKPREYKASELPENLVPPA